MRSALFRFSLPILVVCLAAAASDIQRLKQLEKTGRVQYEYYHRTRSDTNFAAVTTFALSYQAPAWRHTFTTEKRRNKPCLIIEPSIAAVEVAIQHKMRLPAGYSPTNQWYDSLVRHEYDHVAISSDPRAKCLLEHLILNLKRVEVELPEGKEISPQYINQLIRDQINQRKDAVVQLITANYDLLDVTTHHGRKEISDRASFFAGLYSERRLRETGFTYVDDVGTLLASDRYQRAGKASLPVGIPREL